MPKCKRQGAGPELEGLPLTVLVQDLSGTNDLPPDSLATFIRQQGSEGQKQGMPCSPALSFLTRQAALKARHETPAGSLSTPWSPSHVL